MCWLEDLSWYISKFASLETGMHCLRPEKVTLCDQSGVSFCEAMRLPSEGERLPISSYLLHYISMTMCGRHGNCSLKCNIGWVTPVFFGHNIKATHFVDGTHHWTGPRWLAKSEAVDADHCITPIPRFSCSSKDVVECLRFQLEKHLKDSMTLKRGFDYYRWRILFQLLAALSPC